MDGHTSEIYFTIKNKKIKCDRLVKITSAIENYGELVYN